MKFQDFVDGITEIVARSGEHASVVFYHNEEKGLYKAITSNGEVFTGNSTSLKTSLFRPHHDPAQFVIDEVLQRMDVA